MNRAKPASALGPSWRISKTRQIANCIKAVQDMWKKPQQKSMRDTSVEIWLTSFPLGRVDRARLVNWSERWYIAVINPPRTSTPVPAAR